MGRKRYGEDESLRKEKWGVVCDLITACRVFICGRLLIHRTVHKSPHYVSAVLGQQSLISVNLLSCTWTLQHRRLIDRKENTKTLTSPPMGPWGPCGPCCPGGPWWDVERLSISHISLDMYTLFHSLSLSYFCTISIFLSVREVFFLYFIDMVVTGYYRRADFLSVCCVCVLMRTISLLHSLVTLHEFSTPEAYLLLLQRAEHEPLIKLAKIAASTPHVVSTERY